MTKSLSDAEPVERFRADLLALYTVLLRSSRSRLLKLEVSTLALVV